MLVAAVDSATQTLSCALVGLDGPAFEVIATRTDRPTGASGHAIRLPGALTELLGALGRGVRDVDAFAVGLGPGSFTGLRIGLATWKGLAYANRRPIAGASSLAAMALEACRSLPAGATPLLVPLLDARKGEVYAGFYRPTPGGVEPVHPEQALSPAVLAERASTLGSVVAFGEGYEAHRAALAPALADLPGAPATPSAEAVGRLAAARLQAGPFDDRALFALEPHYVRKSEAEVKFPNGIP